MVLVYVACLAVCDKILYKPTRAVETAGMGNQQFVSGFAREAGNLGGALVCKRKGDFNQYVFAGLQRQPGLFVMRLAGRCDNDRVDIGVGQDVFVARGSVLKAPRVPE